MSGVRKPAISVVVVSYNMEREIVRTIQTLSTRMQRGIEKSEYEVLLVDNGSADTRYLRALADEHVDLRVLSVDQPLVSPAQAVNLGLQHARGDLVGVMVDGARMASPGLLANALRASRLHHRPVIASLGFHLGHEVQSRSVHEGYNQQVEDRLLDSVPWAEDGYRLFDISVLAGSSSGGWFAPIAESSALFMHREMWSELGGYDLAFRTRGGGYLNLDTYKRACALPDSQLVMLLGEGTFHQFHGGIATNSLNSPDEEFRDEYRSLRGSDYALPSAAPWYFGSPGQDWKLLRR